MQRLFKQDLTLLKLTKGDLVSVGDANPQEDCSVCLHHRRKDFDVNASRMLSGSLLCIASSSGPISTSGACGCGIFASRGPLLVVLRRTAG
jgi:hypothetical protein